MRTLGIIGGSGLYDIPGMTNVEQVYFQTPFGAPSGPLVIGHLEGTRLVFLARHGRGHTLSPSDINYRANIHALKEQGVEQLITFSAVGSLKEGIAPESFIIADQFIDLTKSRVSTFFDGGAGIVAHVGMGTPVCEFTAGLLHRAAVDTQTIVSLQHGGTMVVMEGPQFSTKAESHLYRSWGADIIGMTAMPEAKLAREAEMCYATVAMVTDYDCWHEEIGHVTAEEVHRVMAKNVSNAKAIIRLMAARHTASKSCKCNSALKGAIMSNPSEPFGIPVRFNLLLAKYS